MEKKQKAVIIVAGVILFAIIQYMVFEKILDENQKRLSEIYQDGYERGFKDTILTLFEETSDCGVTSIWSGNLSRQISDSSCVGNLSP